MVPPAATQVETSREVMKAVVTAVELTQGTSRPRVKTPMPGPLVTPPSRVELCHWSRSDQILSSHWWAPY